MLPNRRHFSNNTEPLSNQSQSYQGGGDAADRPIDKITYSRDNFFFLSQNIDEVFENNVLKFKVMLVLYYFELKTSQSVVISHEKCKMGSQAPPPW